MKNLAALAVAIAATSPVFAQEGADMHQVISPALEVVSPALDAYAHTVLADDLWLRDDLAPRDRSIVTIAALVSKNQSAELGTHVALALDNGVTPAEISEIITHLAFYSGWGNAVAAAPIIADVFEARGIGAEQISAADVELLPLDEEAEAARAARVAESIGPVSPGLDQYTTDPLFTNLWLRPDLAPRDRSLVTITSLIANGQSAQLTVHLNTAMNNGVTAEEAGGVIAHLAFYSGWPNAFSAAPVAREVIESRQK